MGLLDKVKSFFGAKRDRDFKQGGASPLPGGKAGLRERRRVQGRRRAFLASRTRPSWTRHFWFPTSIPAHVRWLNRRAAQYGMRAAGLRGEHAMPGRSRRKRNAQRGYARGQLYPRPKMYVEAGKLLIRDVYGSVTEVQR